MSRTGAMLTHATANGKTVTVKVTNICTSCGPDDIQLSTPAFDELVPDNQSPSSLSITWTIPSASSTNANTGMSI